MAQRRMFAQSFLLDDDFASLPDSTRCLYFYLAIMADDDGFLKSASSVILMSRTSEKDLEALIEAGFLHRFDSGVIVINHWHLHNRIQKDRYRPTQYREERDTLELRDKVYCVSNLDPQDRLGKDRIDKISIDKHRLSPGPEEAGSPGVRPTLKEVTCYCMEQDIFTTMLDFYNYYEEAGWPGDWRKLLRNWERSHNDF